MSRIQTTFAQLEAQGRKGLIPFITAGDPYPSLTVDLMHALVNGGADVIELGIPFSDPMADGPVIQRASERALKVGISLRDVLAYVSQFRLTNQTTPVVLMGYANPVERMGETAFIEAAKTAGVDGILIVDYPPEECENFAKLAKAQQIDPIFLLAPTSADKRIRDVAHIASGYVYYVSLKGVTGSGNLDVTAVAGKIAAIKELFDLEGVTLPVGVGFGIRDAATAKAVADLSDAVVIGSRIVQLLEDSTQATAVDTLQAFIAEVRAKLDS